ncbi:MAG: SigB/SigF/SigG family RNA polymerase sigma factor [Clostridiales bacterium]|nr:SigB/SigF/SigG family RNA polymerase sigma factor [Clostridiales bacterium]
MDKKEMFRKYRETGDKEIRNRIVEEHLYMVDILIRKYLNKGMEYDDLYQVGAMALINAVERFDPEKGFEFSSFATPTILGEIKKHFRDTGWSMKVPRKLKENASAIPAARDALAAKLGRTPTVKELAEEMNIGEDELLEAMQGSLAYGTFSLDQTFEEEEKNGDNPVFEKYAYQEEKGFDRFENREIIGSVLKKLNSTNQYVFKKRFLEERSQAEIAKKLGVSQMTISRAEKNIKAKFAEELQKALN